MFYMYRLTPKILYTPFPFSFTVPLIEEIISCFKHISYSVGRRIEIFFKLCQCRKVGFFIC